MRILNISKKVLLSSGLLLLMLILLSSLAPAQSAATQNAGNKSWNAFWTKFNGAVKTKNRKSLIVLTSKKHFRDPVAKTINEWLNESSVWRFL